MTVDDYILFKCPKILVYSTQVREQVRFKRFAAIYWLVKAKRTKTNFTLPRDPPLSERRTVVYINIYQQCVYNIKAKMFVS